MTHAVVRNACGWSFVVVLAGLVAGHGSTQVQRPEIHVDEQCRILTQDRKSDTQKFSKPKYREDPVMCHLESTHASQHWEDYLDADVVARTRVTVLEHEFVLFNPSPVPVTFVVEQPVPKGWHIDSDPQPTEQVGTMAVFRVQAEPGQTVRLHVGARK